MEFRRESAASQPTNTTSQLEQNINTKSLPWEEDIIRTVSTDDDDAEELAASLLDVHLPSPTTKLDLIKPINYAASTTQPPMPVSNAQVAEDSKPKKKPKKKAAIPMQRATIPKKEPVVRPPRKSRFPSRSNSSVYTANYK